MYGILEMILLMEEILHQLIGSLSHYLTRFLHHKWLAGFLNHQQYPIGSMYGTFTYIVPIKINHSWIGKYTVPMDPMGMQNWAVFVGEIWSRIIQLGGLASLNKFLIPGGWGQWQGAEDSRVFAKNACSFINGWLQIQIQKDSKSMGLTEVD